MVGHKAPRQTGAAPDEVGGVLVPAVPVRAAGPGKAYGGFVCAQLKNARTGDTIDAYIAA